jgi:hypothetical protein
MTEPGDDPETEFEGRLRTSLALMAPPATSDGVLESVQRRAVRRRRRVRESMGAALVVLVGGGTVAGLTLTSSPQLATSPPVHVTTVPSSTTPTRSPPSGAAGNPSSIGAASQGHGQPAPEPPPCPAVQNVPSMDTGRFCGPAPGPGSGLGPSGECTGNETAPPCGPGVVPGRFYAYTVPGTCNGLMTFDGKQWVSELPPPNPVPGFDVWLQLGTNGSVRWIAPTGSVGLQPYVGQTLVPCRGSGPEGVPVQPVSPGG